LGGPATRPKTPLAVVNSVGKLAANMAPNASTGKRACDNEEGNYMSADIKFDQLLDAKGMSCPLPILKTKKTIEGLSKDQVLKVETTDPGSKNDMASWAKRTGNEILKTEEGSGTFTFYIKKTA
jgi:tRNA 2-thiouridine synthesizing protein A